MPVLPPWTRLSPLTPTEYTALNRIYAKQAVAGDWSAYPNAERHSHYMGLTCFDSDGLAISAQHHMRFRQGGTDSMTTLTAPLTPGDTVVQVSDATGWNDTSSATENCGVVMYGYRNSAGKTYSHYSRIVAFDLFDLGQVNKTTNIVTLNAPWPAGLGNPDDTLGIWPIGTNLANSANGESDKYSFYNGAVLAETDRWYRSQSYMGGIDYSGENVETNFPPGTATVKPFWLANHTNRSGGYLTYPDTGSAHKAWYTGVSVVAEPLARKAQTAAGSQDLKVPVADFATGAVSLSVPVSSIDAI